MVSALIRVADALRVQVGEPTGFRKVGRLFVAGSP
jgi:hypothetical protein